MPDNYPTLTHEEAERRARSTPGVLVVYRNAVGEGYAAIFRGSSTPETPTPDVTFAPHRPAQIFGDMRKRTDDGEFIRERLTGIDLA